MLNWPYSGGENMKKTWLCMLVFIILAYPLMADSLNDIHKAILNNDLELAKKLGETSNQEGLILVAIAQKEYLNLLAENLILLSEGSTTEKICDELLADFIAIRKDYLSIINKINFEEKKSTLRLRLDTPLSMNESNKKDARNYSAYLLAIAEKKYPRNYKEVKAIINGYFPLAYQVRLLLVSANAPAQNDLHDVLNSGKLKELDMDLQKIWQSLSN